MHYAGTLEDLFVEFKEEDKKKIDSLEVQNKALKEALQLFIDVRTFKHENGANADFLKKESLAFLQSKILLDNLKVEE